ncbi:MAG: tyrosine-type recombinase/integrase [Anaerolineae bacterium]|nr:tyrosine-type recombinase/integrase [Anaerolineae bacterium]
MVKLRLRLSQAIEGYLLEAQSRRLSSHTIADYQNAFNKLIDYTRTDPYLDEITPDTLRRFLEYLGTAPQKPGTTIPRPAKPLKNKTLLNIHIGLSALWTWAVREGHTVVHVPHEVRPPRPEKRVIIPFSQAEIAELLDAANHSAPYKHRRSGQRACNDRPTSLRDIAIILALLDTGIRASELCGLIVADLDRTNGRLRVMGKGAKERTVAIGKHTSRAIWRYMATRPDHTLGQPLFANENDETQPLTRRALHLLINRMGKRAGINNCHPHRFRHTFAIEFLRNGGDVLKLKALLGHSSLEMVQRYVHFVNSDCAIAHASSDPGDNWKL